MGGAWPPSVSPSRCRLLSRDRPLPAGGASIRCHGDGVRLPFPIGQGVRGAGPRSVTRETASLAPVLALPLAAAAPVPAGGALPMAAALEAALGTACCWGLSPALDLHQHRELRLPARFPPPPPPAAFFPVTPIFFFPVTPDFPQSRMPVTATRRRCSSGRRRGGTSCSRHRGRTGSRAVPSPYGYRMGGGGYRHFTAAPPGNRVAPPADLRGRGAARARGPAASLPSPGYRRTAGQRRAAG